MNKKKCRKKHGAELLAAAVLTALMLFTFADAGVSRSAWHELYQGTAAANYAPNGLPDFDQRQDESWKKYNHWSHCGPASAADVLWYLDSLHENPNGFPGDHVNDWNLVPACCVPPFCAYDDHGTDNPWFLIENLADYTGTDTWWGGWLLGAGTKPSAMKQGLEDWIYDRGLSSYYNVQWIEKPHFNQIKSAVDQNYGVILFMYVVGLKGKNVHWVAVRGYRTSPDELKISDPAANKDGAGDDDTYTVHNDAAIVSHDIYEIVPSTYYKAQYKLIHLWANYPGYDETGHITDAVIIEDFTYLALPAVRD
jgi:hypothetical protein